MESRGVEHEFKKEVARLTGKYSLSSRTGSSQDMEFVESRILDDSSKDAILTCILTAYMMLECGGVNKHR